MAMMLANMGINGITPASLNVAIKNSNGLGYASGCDVYWEAIDSIYHATHFQGLMKLPEKLVCKDLAAGYGIIASVNGGTHYVLLTGCRGGGQFSTLDPALGATVLNLKNVELMAVYAPAAALHHRTGASSGFGPIAPQPRPVPKTRSGTGSSTSAIAPTPSATSTTSSGITAPTTITTTGMTTTGATPTGWSTATVSPSGSSSSPSPPITTTTGTNTDSSSNGPTPTDTDSSSTASTDTGSSSDHHHFPPPTHCGRGCGGKPVLMLYPEQTTPVTVTLRLQDWWTMTTTWPAPTPTAQGAMWRVTAAPGGELQLPSADMAVPYLFWEAQTQAGHTVPWVLEPGPDTFCVARKAVGEWLNGALERLGLNARERGDMITYWLARLEDKPYVLLRFLTAAELGPEASYTLSPAPDTFIRVFMIYKPLEQAMRSSGELPAEAPLRVGFTAVEWGGMDVTGYTP